MAASSDCADSKMPCVCARPSNQLQQCLRVAPRAWPLIFPSKSSITLWNSLQTDCQMISRGSNLDSNLNSAAWPDHWFFLLNLRLPSGTACRQIARWSAGAQPWTQTWTLPPDQRNVMVLSPPKPQHKLCGVWILLKSVTDAKIEPSGVKFLMLMPWTGVCKTERI